MALHGHRDVPLGVAHASRRPFDEGRIKTDVGASKGWTFWPARMAPRAGEEVIGGVVLESVTVISAVPADLQHADFAAGNASQVVAENGDLQDVHLQADVAQRANDAGGGGHADREQSEETVCSHGDDPSALAGGETLDVAVIFHR